MSTRIVAPSLERFTANHADPEPAGSLMLGKTLAGIVIVATAGSIGHAMARALGGRFDVHHGLACGILLPHKVRHNLSVREKKLAEVARAMGLPTEGLSQIQKAEKAIEGVDELLRAVSLPTDLRNLGATEEDIQTMAKMVPGNSGANPRKATLADIIAILRQIL